ncbi:acyl-CoA thioesterase [Citromicrobium sp. RCC1885]|uniref:acyl-CoA thioesterase n=1 Tax=unclassified Citromicrobium TaxID=2630544 RepID=UPI0006C915B8|nr:MULTISPECIES: acyl-CoA thioesterase II [unclassified Citromicrobium]KPM23120.1 acyl-CoA thioesterase [Citromicrobium sp. RCC1885]KPM26527.1 acyl-CoA thioesterase [Citromicrobium sp. RCC1878]MAO04004.1 acyl-CoA thioesterase II [Citromicrobium sp.]OAM08961.1 acyl-CoA thioesterase II [Citromicrobium sp. RCC1897]|tara:strand:+ start:1568 stop:2500 length:933 start_codon:yes stop_codon:yes gene_type:complete
MDSASPASPKEETAQELANGLVELLSLERSSDDRFVGQAQPGGVGRVFGGQVIAQALQAAQATIADGKQAHSLHAYFLRGGEEGPPIDYATERDFDGRSFSNRRVVASQGGTPILNLTASFQRAEEGLSHQAAPMPDVPGPEDLPSDDEVRAKALEAFGEKMSDAQRALMMRPRPIEMRSSGRQHWLNPEPREPHSFSWFRLVAPLPDDPAIHRAVIAYASDYTLLGTAVLPHGLSWMRGELISASLDHAIWFHAHARADEWLLYETDSPWSGSGRGYNRGRIFTRDGVLVASVAQEGMIRQARRKKGSD